MKRKRAFSKLSEAVRFLAEHLEADESGRLAEASRDPLPPEWVLDRLREIHTATPLTELYAGREFPAAAREFKLGGHAKELGHIHIDFVRTRTGWQIQRLWMCR